MSEATRRLFIALTVALAGAATGCSDATPGSPPPGDASDVPSPGDVQGDVATLEDTPVDVPPIADTGPEAVALDTYDFDGVGFGYLVVEPTSLTEITPSVPTAGAWPSIR